MKVALLAFGSRGDIQPFLALGTGLRARGHEVDLATTTDFKGMVEHAGLNFREIPGSTGNYFKMPGVIKALRKSPSIVRASRAIPRPTQDEVVAALDAMHEATQGADFMVNAMLTRGAGYADPGVPWGTVAWWPIVPTGRFPAFGFPELPLGAPYARLSHSLAGQLDWAMNRGPVNKFRKNRGLPPLSGGSPAKKLGVEYPVFHATSPSVVVPPSDWPARAHVTGYWFWDRPWEPPAELVDFLESGEPPVALTLGSTWPVYGEETFERVLKAVRKAGRRMVLVDGPEGDMPDDVFRAGEMDYSWLFPRTAAVIHHGGPGTVAEVLRAGVPNVVLPCFADHPYWAARLLEMGVSSQPVPLTKLTQELLDHSVSTVLGDPRIAERAAALGPRIVGDRGVETTCELIEGYVNGQASGERDASAAR
ncbi:glycosyltransferase [Streptomyces sp. NPDC005900]|uniref:glycosyltransferase n=1 Tax=unclassified Streptomyces TaxID=2593676 RepID=UPI0034110861